MTEFIDRSIVEQTISEVIRKGGNFAEILTEVHFLPAADVRPVVHGHWRRTPMACYGGGTITEYECSVCDEHQISDSPFCPNCGAQMEVEHD